MRTKEDRKEIFFFADGKNDKVDDYYKFLMF